MKVLVVDDNKEITDMLSLYFDTQGIEFKAINDGKEGLEAIRKEESDLVLLDLAIPNFSGIDILNSLKKENLIEKKNIIIFTASSEGGTLVKEVQKLGAKDILKKPVDMKIHESLVTKFHP